MSTDVLLLVFYLALALGVSFACSIFEAVLLSITPGFVAALEKQPGRSANRIKALKADIDRPLAAILSLNTIAHTVGAAGVGAQSAKVFGGYVGVTSGVLTVLILIASEIIPKSLGASHWKRLSPTVALLLTPVTFVMTITGFVPVARLITRWMGGSGHGHLPSREEISAIAEQGAREGLFPTGEGRILENLFRLAHLQASDIMTPRTVLFALPEATRIGDLIERDPIPFSRIPLTQGSLDELSGYVLKDDMLLRAAKDELDLTLGEIRRPLIAVSQGLKLSDLFERLLKEQAHLAVVVDDYGGTAGVVTMEDLVETLIGIEIVDEADAVTDMRELARRQWEKRAARNGILMLDRPQPAEPPAKPGEPPTGEQPAKPGEPPVDAQPEAEGDAAPADEPPTA